MEPVTRKMIERPELDSKFSEQVDQKGIDSLTWALIAIAALMLVTAGAWILLGSASFLSLVMISVLALLLISSPTS